MSARDISQAVERTNASKVLVCTAITVLLPILRDYTDRRSFAVRWILRGLLDALEQYSVQQCGQPHPVEPPSTPAPPPPTPA